MTVSIKSDAVMRLSDISEEWRRDCHRWRGPVLTGLHAHWYWNWDFLPVDETSLEWESCSCYAAQENLREVGINADKDRI